MYVSLCLIKVNKNKIVVTAATTIAVARIPKKILFRFSIYIHTYVFAISFLVQFLFATNQLNYVDIRNNLCVRVQRK